MRLLLIALITLSGFTAVAATEKLSLPGMLGDVEKDYLQNKQVNKERLEQFRKNAAAHKKMLTEIARQLKAKEKKAETLGKKFDENKKKINDLKALLNEQLGAMNNVFAELLQAAGETRASFQNSLISVQYPNRVHFLDALIKKITAPSELASVSDMETFWQEISNEIIASAEVERFAASVVQTDGSTARRMVVRIGTFNAIANGKYLDYQAGTNSYYELERQPRTYLLELAEKLQEATDGHVPFGVDPSRGDFLSILANEPDIIERIEQGGIVGYIIIALGVLALLIAFSRLLVLAVSALRLRRQIKRPEKAGNNAIGRMMRVYQQSGDSDVEALELKLEESIHAEIPRFNRGLLFLKIVAVIAPLLGLLGTVTGMIVTFQAISLFGTGEPKYMADGISQALVTTVLGLAVAIPVIFLHTLASSSAKNLRHTLEKYALGLLAERAVRK